MFLLLMWGMSSPAAEWCLWMSPWFWEREACKRGWQAPAPHPWRGDWLGKPWGWGTGCPLLDMCADLCEQLIIWVSHMSGACCVGIASVVYHCSPLSVPGWVLHEEARWKNFFLYTVGVNQHFGKCNYKFASCGNLCVSHTWSVWSSSMAQLFH